MKDGLIRVGAAAPTLTLADPGACAAACAAAATAAAARGVRVLAMPELCLLGYSCGDLLLSDTLLHGAENALAAYIEATATLDLLSFVGLPVSHGGRVYNCLAAVCRGRLLGLVPKTHLPNYAGCEEVRWFAPAPATALSVRLCGSTVQMDTRQLFCCDTMPALAVACEICEDMWVACPPSCAHTAAGATLIVNASANRESAGGREAKVALVRGLSARLHTAYLYADAGEGESTTDAVFAGHCLLSAGGALIDERPPFAPADQMAVGEVDLARLLHARATTSTWQSREEGYTRVPFSLSPCQTTFSHAPAPSPFLPQDGARRAARLDQILSIQVAGLAARLQRAHAAGAVLGISGGLDSTLALLLTVRALDRLGLPRTACHAVTMPGFGTTERTKGNADALCQALGVRLSCIPVAAAVRQHFADIGHDEAVQDAVYENAQARERTQILMDLSNQENSLVIGTGDLSELALGFATYNGDHMSMYGVNAALPKTVVRALCTHLAHRYAAEGESALSAILLDIVETPVSPELLPPQENGEIAQRTEDLVGPYELHDFFLYYMLRCGFSPRKLLRYACAAFAGQFDGRTVGRWLRVFLRRFFTQQFKRSCMPDGPAIFAISLSPRGAWRMPSDARPDAFLAELDAALLEEGLS